MRILQINSSSTFGGGERHFADLCSGLSQAGHEVFAAIRPTCEWKYRLEALPEERVLPVALRNALDIFSAAQLARKIRREKIDIVHAHLARDYPIAAISIRQARSCHLVLTRHVLFPLKNIQRVLLKNAAAVIAVSEGVRSNLTKTFPPEKIVCVPNGLTIKPLEDAARSAEEFRFENNISFDDLVITNIGELSHLKGQREFVLSAAEVLKESPEAFFVVVGKDRTIDQRNRRDLKRLTKIMDMSDRFLFLDWVEDLRPLLAATDIFVSSSHSESFGLAILEAMESGLPVVATATVGARELIKHGGTGVLVPIDDAVALAREIVNLIKDSDRRASIGTSAQTSARKHFSLERMIEKTVQVYDSVLNK